MRKHDDARRAFLIGAAAGAGAAAGVAFDAFAQAPEQHKPTHAPATDAQATAHVHTGGHGAFLNDEDSATVAVFVERIMPGAPDKPGASNAGVLNYIDLALSGAYADLQDFYRRGLTALDAYCRKTHNAPFAGLDAEKQNEVIAALEQGKATDFTWPTQQAFFNTLRTHTMEGMFADPIYGGNKDFAGWRLVGFPGAQPLFSAEDMASKEAFTRVPIIGLQSQAAMQRG